MLCPQSLRQRINPIVTTTRPQQAQDNYKLLMIVFIMKLKKIIFELPVLFVPEIPTAKLKEVKTFWKTKHTKKKN